jgi:multiple sugar transport system permease protein
MKTNTRKILNAILITLITLILLALFLSPFVYMVFTSLKTQEQISVLGSPIWPAAVAVYEYEDENGEIEELEIYTVPFEDGSQRDLAMLKPGRKESIFIDPSSGEQIVWAGNWRGLERPWQLSPTWSNYVEVWESIAFPRLLWNTTMYAVVSNVGVLISCTLVAFGFSRFDYPGRDFLFIMLISAIFLPGTVTIIPTYTFFTQIGWVGTWWPLYVPAFFANAYDTFLLRQYFMTLPKALDEAAMIDGAGPFRVLWSVIVPQAYPALMAITVFHIVYAWNDFFGPLIYLTGERDKWPVSIALSTFNGIYGSRPELIQAASLMTLILPVILFFAAQRFFIQGIVITGVEK